MKKILKIFKKYSAGQNGMAILFTLGILALLLVMAITFAGNSVVERRASYNADSRTSAIFLAKSALNRVLGALSLYNAAYGLNGVTAMSSYYSPQTYDFIWKLNTYVDGTAIYGSGDGMTNGINSNTYTGTASNTYASGATTQVVNVNAPPYWIYAFDGTPQNSIIGRFAYVVIPSASKLDPSASIMSGYSESTVLSSGVGGYYCNNKPRPGVKVNEIALNSLDTSATYLTSAVLSAMTSGITTPGTTRWTDLEGIFSAAGLAANAYDQKNKLRSWLVTNNPPDSEAFWIDANGNGIKENTEYYQRFNMMRQDWNSLPVTVATLTGASTVYNTTENTSSGLQWLASWTDPGGMSSVTACKNQIAANIINYCSPSINDDPTNGKYAVTDYSGVGGYPTYVGLGKWPYINEVRFEFKNPNITQISDYDAPGSGNKSFEITTADFAIDVELINLYDNQSICNAYIEFSGSYNWVVASTTYTINFSTRAGDSTGAIVITSSGNTINISLPTLSTTGTVSKYSYSTSVSFPFTSTTIKPTGIKKYGLNSDSSSITNFTINQLYVRLLPSKIPPSSSTSATAATTSIYDFAKIIIPGSNASTLADSIVSNGTETRYFDFEVDDPRQNLEPNDWQYTGVLYGVKNNSSAGSLGVKNSVCAPNTTVKLSSTADYESLASSDLIVAGTSCNISTAYVRSPTYTQYGMRSPWELGAIHRGKKWQTLNLKKYYAGSSGAGAGVTPGTYDKGDANILDMVKFVLPSTVSSSTADQLTSTYGKVNLNTTSADVLRALFMDIYMSSDYSNPSVVPSTGAGVIGSSPADLFATAIKNITSVTPYVRRSQVADVLYNGVLTSGSFVDASGASFSLSNKRYQDQIIGKMINLTRAEPEYVNVIIVAQTIRDAPNGTIAKDLIGDGTLKTLSASDVASVYYVGYYQPANTNGFTGVNSYVSVTPPSSFSLNEGSISSTVGTYDLGADEITGECKILATIVFDPVTQKFKVPKFQYLSQ